ncbi:putative 2-dehydropantoate 2-reductase [Pseudomonas sp. gcc21]|uniref:putative 2-dehydropantoate 2-reductase n=1 Tax=Pseudomonas sp. gcc21 TaxID=2726989 RepID=UPI0014513AA0|nr:putative 2-dehydropantoate 2-reductase [Pseudomonas sp. gcc21]QJD58576.1 putative 2-dehydropantoate 2-reductase [Pseudomonas sp. gcc21]
MQNKPRIGIIGTGAMGGFYGLMLAKGGHDVHFLLRSEYQAVVDKGITVNSMVHGDMALDQVQAYRDVAEMPACDWLLIGAKATANEELAPVIAQAAADGAKVILLQNGLNNESLLRPLLPDNVHLIGGMCYVCLFREEPGVINHQFNGQVDLGYHSGPADEAGAAAIISEAAELFKSSGIKSRTMENVDAARWHKLVWNLPFNGMHVVLNAGTRDLLGNPSSHRLIRDMMAEVVTLAAACGCEIPEDFPDKLLYGTSKMPDYHASMYHDWLHKRPMELDLMYGEPLRIAAKQGVSMPKTAALLAMLEFIQAGYLKD